jgi:hypothetical protein
MLPAVVLPAEWYFADTAAKTSPWSALARMVVLVFTHGPLLDGPRRVKGYSRGAARGGHGKVNRGHRWGRRKLNGVTNGAPEKGRRGHTFTHTERALVATFNLSDRTNQNI